ncbi:MAG: hypothetical protein CMI02_09240 [Oceanospirillaceae bacterium]|nr:hypothetical protein [Oceanospirillaceae bacterium]MBT12207.1 hypothetical protein [Oceanospirillaceae bacterium]|tara:strand:- start:171982 stop:173682 length:1701 start_codon:yes stop_codon:yes gene_type:complete
MERSTITTGPQDEHQDTPGTRPTPLNLLVLSTCEEQLGTLDSWLSHYHDEPPLHTEFIHLDRNHHWSQHPALRNITDFSQWHAAIVVVDDLCDIRRNWLHRLQTNLPTILISNPLHSRQLPQAFQRLTLADVTRSHFFRSLKPLQLSLRQDLAPPLNRDDFIAALRHRLQDTLGGQYLQVVQSRWLRSPADGCLWQQQQTIQQEFERTVRLRAPVNALIGRILEDQLVVISDDYYDLQMDWLPQQPDDDARPWVVYHSAPMHLGEFSGLSATLQEAVQQIARERLVQEASFHWQEPDGHSLNLFDGLHLALQKEEFYLEYQPQFDSVSGSWVGAEALMRWRHPSLGVIPPTVFIREAEAAGLIQALGQWALRETATTWRALHELTGQTIRLAVNVSFPEIADPWYADQVLELLAQTGMPAHYLELELTETAMMRDASVSLLNLRRLKNAGVHIVLDDFGTGFSSLAHLSDLPLTGIKLDRAFVSPLPDHGPQSQIVGSMLDLAHRLGLETTAEGVEDAACLEMVRRLGCDRIQGYIYAQPLTLEELIGQAVDGFNTPKDFSQHSLF